MPFEERKFPRRNCACEEWQRAIDETTLITAQLTKQFRARGIRDAVKEGTATKE